jgi:hypothetical protein
MNATSRPVISVTALSPEGPVAMARVTVESAPGSLPDVAGLTGDDGSFTLSTSGPGRYVVAVHAPGFRSARAELDVGSTDRHVDVDLVPER